MKGSGRGKGRAGKTRAPKLAVPRTKARRAAVTPRPRRGPTDGKPDAGCGPLAVMAPTAPATKTGFAVVGVGASAGGLEAFRQFLASMPGDSGMAFVLVQHLDPTHMSLTAELLDRHTQLSVTEAEDETEVQPNHAYVIPPNRYITISGRRLHLTEPVEHRGLRVPIDFFFRSLADDQQERAIGILLSGTGSDGTLGVREIKAAGGMVMVQAPETAPYDGMLRSAIATGVVDYVLPIQRMPEHLQRYVRHGYLNGGEMASVGSGDKADHLHAIVALVRARSKFDFSGYKKGTLSRRVQRRMGLHHIEDVGAYLEFLRKSKDEVNALHRDLLIGVTNFFREREAWAALEELVLSPLVRAHGDGVPIRAWVPACATGEEPYSLAMLLMEHCQREEKTCEIQIFASDIDADALAFARAGVYPETIVADVPLARLQRFFTKGEHTYRINKELRESVVFAEQNVIGDPPFSKLDLISCRNLLIYLEPDVQKRVLALFHFALLPGGFLFLGNSETISRQSDLFHAVSRKHRIFTRTGPTRLDRVENFPPVSARAVSSDSVMHESPESPGRRLVGLAYQLMLQRFAPACAVINRRAEVLYLNGPVDLYLQLPSGEPSTDLVSMARGGLKNRLRAAVGKAISEQQRVVVSGVALKGSKAGLVRVSVEPLREPREADGLLLVVFEDENSGEGRDRATAPAEAAALEVEGSESEIVIRRLEDDLRGMRDDLQSTIEELETSNEEFKAANEEVTSINEELQSTNEELETSKEEMQSLNEELQTVNSQLELKVSELESANNDLANLLASTDVATIFLDRQFHIRRFTPATRRLLRVIDSDLGRPLADLASNFSDERLLPDAEIVLQSLAPLEREVNDSAGRWYLRRIGPYRTEDDRIDGVVVTFTDITARKADEDALRVLNDQLERRITQRTAEVRRLIENAPDATLVVSSEGTILEANRRAEAMFNYARGALSGIQVEALVPEHLRTGHVEERQRFAEAPAARAMGEGRELFARRADGSELAVDVQLTPMEMNGKEVTVAAIRDVTSRRLAEATRTRLAAVIEASAAAMVTTGLDGRIDTWNRGAERLYGFAAAEAVGRKFHTLFPAGHASEFESIVEALQRGGAVEDLPAVQVRADGSAVDVEFSASLVGGEGGGAPGVFFIITDVRVRRAVEERAARLADEDRQMTGRELHDTLGQQIAGIGLLVAALRDQVATSKPAAETAANIAAAVDQAKQQIRSLLKGVFPVSVEAQGLRRALEELAEETTRVYGVPCRVEFARDSAAEFPSEDNFTATQLFLIAREAVHNAVRHAAAQEISIRLDAGGPSDPLQLSVRDDGKGMPQEVKIWESLGLRTMRFRSALVGGWLAIERPSGGGTLVICRKPAART